MRASSLRTRKRGVNPLGGWTPSVPTGEKADFGSPAFLEHEALGLQELDGCAFVLVAGGLGERLGYSGIKLALPTQISTSEPYIALYIRQILALQRHAAAATGRAVVLPLMIMVSDDTAGPTDALLRANGFWGMTPEQVTLLKQEKVACVADNATSARHRSAGPVLAVDKATRPRRRPLPHALFGSCRKVVGRGPTLGLLLAGYERARL